MSLKFLRLIFLSIGIQSFLFPCNLIAQDNLVIFSENGFDGLKTGEGEILIAATYDKLGWSDGFDMSVDNVIGYKEEQWGLISTKNKKITSSDYYDLWPVHKDLIIASRKGKFTNRLFYGALNSRGDAVVDFKYSSIKRIVDLLIVSQDINGETKYGLLNEKNQFLLNPQYASIKHFSNHVYVFADDCNKKGLIESNGTILVPLSLDSISHADSFGRATTFSSGKTGLIDQNGNVLLDPIHKRISSRGNEVDITQFSMYTIVDKSNNPEGKFHCDSLRKVSNDFYAIYRNHHTTITDKSFNTILEGSNIQYVSAVNDKLTFKTDKYGVLTAEGFEMIPAEYDSIYADSRYFYLLKDESWSVINKFGRKITKKKYEDIKPDSENMIAVKRRGYWGFIDFQGDQAITHKFDEVTPFMHLTSKVKFLDAFGAINQFGEWICQPVYDDLLIHDEGVIEARSKSRIDLINHQGQVIFQTYNNLTPYDGGFIEETEDGKIGFVMRDGRIVKHPVFDDISFTMKDSILIARNEGYLSLATKEGQRFYNLSGRFEQVLGISEDFVGIKLDGKYGFVDLQGRLRVANRYDLIRLFSDGMAAFYLRGNWGYIDKMEKLRVQPIYDSSFDYQNGTAIVVEDGKYGVIDMDGSYLVELDYDMITRNEFGSFLIQADTKYGITNESGGRIASNDYTYIEQVEKDQIIVKRRGKYGVLNGTGRFTIPMMYKNITYLGNGRYIVVEANDKVDTRVF